jgi:hypothetical protein
MRRHGSPPSIHHLLVFVPLELEEIVGRILEEKRCMLLPLALEPDKRIFEKTHATTPNTIQKTIIRGSLPECKAKMSWIQLGIGIDFIRRQMADDLVAEKLQRDAVVIAAGQPRPDSLDVELLRLVQVTTGNRQVKNARPFYVHVRDAPE